MDRNVAGRLLAVAMGAAQLNLTNTAHILNVYNATCRDTLGLDPLLCDLHGFLSVSMPSYQRRWREHWTDWKKSICDRMTEWTSKRVLNDFSSYRNKAFTDGNKYLWQSLSQQQPLGKRQSPIPNDSNNAPATTKTKVGVLLDLVNGMQSSQVTSHVLQQYLAPLHISLLQLRLVDNNAFAMELQHLPSLTYSPLETTTERVPTTLQLATILETAKQLGMEAFPEITITTNAGGWGGSGFLLKCPEAYCSQEEGGRGVMANNISSPEFLPVVYGVLRELLELFSTTSSHSYLHLGYDERQSHVKCYQEDGTVDSPTIYDDFERNLTMMLQDMLGIPTQNVVRWENTEHVHYADRAGLITQYPSTVPFKLPTVREKEPFFLSIDILAQPTVFDVYIHTRELMKLKPQAIMAELRRSDDQVWMAYQGELRLAAFRMGTNMQSTPLDPKKFQKMLLEECTRLGFVHCEKEDASGVADWKGKIKNLLISEDMITYKIESEETRKETCDRFTSNKSVRTMKAEFVV